jgi:hypothetical protein
MSISRYTVTVYKDGGRAVDDGQKPSEKLVMSINDYSRKFKAMKAKVLILTKNKRQFTVNYWFRPETSELPLHDHDQLQNDVFISNGRPVLTGRPRLPRYIIHSN